MSESESNQHLTGEYCYVEARRHLPQLTPVNTDRCLRIQIFIPLILLLAEVDWLVLEIGTVQGSTLNIGSTKAIYIPYRLINSDDWGKLIRDAFDGDCEI
jgi:hypothetical protein